MAGKYEVADYLSASARALAQSSLACFHSLMISLNPTSAVSRNQINRQTMRATKPVAAIAAPSIPQRDRKAASGAIEVPDLGEINDHETKVQYQIEGQSTRSKREEEPQAIPYGSCNA